MITRHGLPMDAIFNSVDKMLDHGSITTRKTSNDEDSFYIMRQSIKLELMALEAKQCLSPRSQTCMWKIQAKCPHPQLAVESTQIWGVIASTNWANTVTTMMENITEEIFSLKILIHFMEMKLISFFLDNNGNKSETRLGATVKDQDVSIGGNNIYRNDRNPNVGRMGIYVKEGLPELVAKITNNELELLALEFSPNHGKPYFIVH